FPVGKPVNLGNERLIINPGGVGQPRDGDPRASFAIYDDAQKTITHLRAEYDVAKTQKKILANGLPKVLADRLEFGR
ncbi:MAG: metallophosphoesterase, partial [Chloroflexi bacterium]|nr:metallophosphoesterase [Chloroflexota bacterium]